MHMLNFWLWWVGSILNAWLDWNAEKIHTHLRLQMSVIKYFFCEIGSFFTRYINTHIIMNNRVVGTHQKNNGLTSKDCSAILAWYWTTLLLQIISCWCHSGLEELLILTLYDITVRSCCTLVMFNILLYDQMKPGVTLQEEKICLYDINITWSLCNQFYTQLSLKKSGYMAIWCIIYC